MRDTTAYRRDYGSRLRDGAGLLTLASETGSGPQVLAAIGRIIEEERAARALHQHAGQRLDGARRRRRVAARCARRSRSPSTAPRTRARSTRTYREAALDAAGRSSRNTGNGAGRRWCVNVAGNPIGFEPALSRGFAVERSYYRLDGTKLEPAEVCACARTSASSPS